MWYSLNDRIMSAGSILGHWHNVVFRASFQSVSSCIHLGFLQLFDFEVEFEGLPGGLKKRKKKHILARYQTRLGLTFHIHCFLLDPYRDSNIPNPFQVAFIDGTCLRVLLRVLLCVTTCFQHVTCFTCFLY